MVQLTAPVELFDGDTANIDTVKKHPLGTRAQDSDGNIYIYMQGVASLTATANVVSYDENFVTTLLAADAVGRVAVAMAVLDATTKFGWFQIYGKNTAVASDTVSDNTPLYIDGTAGRVDDAGVAGDWISGMFARSASSSNLITAELDFPFVSNGAYLV